MDETAENSESKILPDEEDDDEEDDDEEDDDEEDDGIGSLT